MIFNRIAWSPALAQRIARVRVGPTVELRRAYVATLLRDPDALHRFTYRWDIFLAYCARCERHPQIMARDPECIDVALIELSATVALIPADDYSKLHRIRRIRSDLEDIAERTRPFRRRCAFAQHRTPAEA